MPFLFVCLFVVRSCRVGGSGGLELVGGVPPDVVRAVRAAVGLLRGLLAGEETSARDGGEGGGRPHAGVGVGVVRQKGMKALIVLLVGWMDKTAVSVWCRRVLLCFASLFFCFFCFPPPQPRPGFVCLPHSLLPSVPPFLFCFVGPVC